MFEKISFQILFILAFLTGKFCNKYFNYSHFLYCRSRIPCRHNFFNKVTFSINNMNLSKTNNILSDSYHTHISCRYIFFNNSHVPYIQQKGNKGPGTKNRKKILEILLLDKNSPFLTKGILPARSEVMKRIGKDILTNTEVCKL